MFDRFNSTIFKSLKSKVTQIDVLEHVIYYLTLAYIVLVPLNYSISRKTLYVIIVFSIIYFLISKNWKFYTEKPTLICLIFFIITVLSLINVPSSLLGQAGNGIRKTFIYIVFFLVTVDLLRTEKRLWYLIYCLLITCTITSIDALIQYNLGYSILNHEGLFINAEYNDALLGIYRVTSNFGHPDSISVLLGGFVFIFMSLGFFYLEGFRGLFFKVVTTICLFALFLTFSRGVAFAMIVAGVLFILLKRSVGVVIYSILIVSVMLLILPKGVKTWIVDAKSFSDLYVGVQTKHMKYQRSGRLEQWRAALNMIKAHPFTGVGIHTFSYRFDQYKLPHDTKTKMGPHNLYLAIASEMGIFALLITLLGLILLFFACIKTFYKPRNREIQIISLGLMCSLTFFILFGIYGSSVFLGTWRLGPTLWLPLVLVVAVYRLNFRTKTISS